MEPMEVDGSAPLADEIRAVEGQIVQVQNKIDDVVSKLERAQDSAEKEHLRREEQYLGREKQYLRREKQYLRREKELLLEKEDLGKESLRREKELLRRKNELLEKEDLGKESLRREKELMRRKNELLLEKEDQLNPRNEDGLEAQIRRVRDKFLSQIRRVLSALAPEEVDYKSHFPQAIKPLCSFGGHQEPLLLWEGVGSGQVELDPRLAAAHASDITVLLAPSGSGKTRQLIELACTRFTLFFSGGVPLSGTARGSRDLERLATVVGRLMPLGKNDSNDAALRLCVRVVMFARLSIFKLLMELRPNLTPREWVFFQLEYSSVRDVFLELTDGYFEKIVSSSDVTALVIGFQTVLDELLEELRWRQCTIILDEAQVLLRKLPGRFQSGSHTDGQGLLNPLTQTMLECASLKSNILVSGTGKGMLTVRDHYYSGTVKTFKVLEICRLSAFDSTNIVPYLEDFIDVSRVDLDAVTATYRGRRRLLTTALENYLVETAPASDWFVQYAWRMISETGGSLGVFHSLRDEASKIWANPFIPQQFVENLLFTYHLSGFAELIFPADQYAMMLVDSGCASLLQSSDGVEEFKPLFETIIGAQGDEVKRYVILSEPLVIAALWNTIPRGTRMKCLINRVLSPSVLGDLDENEALIGEAFDKKVPAEVIGVKDAHPVYQKKYKLLKPRSGAPVLVQRATCVDDVRCWLQQVEEGVRFATYLHTGEVTQLGPDLIFILEETESELEESDDEMESEPVDVSDGSVKQLKKLPVFVQFKTEKNVGAKLVQFKTGKNVGATQAFSSVDFGMLSKVLGRGLLENWCRDGYIRLVVSTEDHPRLGAVAFQGLQQGLRRGKSKDYNNGVDPLSAVWVEKRLVGLVDEDILIAVEEARGNFKRRKAIVVIP